MKYNKIHQAVLAAALSAIAGGAFADVKIGLSAPLSGTQAVVGQEQVDGFMLALEQLGGKLGGQAATVVKEDDQLKPELGNQIIRKFLEKDKVDAIVGLGYSNVLMASLKPIVESGTVAIATNAGPSPVAGASCAANVFSTAWQNDGAAEAMGKYVQDKGIKRVYLMAPNYQAGKDMLAGFKRMYKGEIVDEVYTQVGQTDYSAELAQLQAAKPDAVFAFYPGGMGVSYIRQLSQAGMLGKPANFSVFTIDGTTMPALKDAAVGTVSGAMWDAALDTPENKKFVAAFEARYKRTPSEYAATAYDAAQILNVALTKVKGNTADKKAFAAAVKAAGQEFKSVRGPFKFNNNNLPIQNYYAFEVVKEGGKPAVKLAGTPLQNHSDAYHAKCQLK
ncbi:amino acid/amide ABC transporter substrate-binding protein, HAAT family [Noviherbaspirillum humi]|uniref:Amino acid/amide ABC transporter substrate-binding protein, HAAT family n=1 Tax=Noviherbaspirillum humi TaxID=1688639 RepID=A0A239M5I1_9BURK|nr:ABC transporter substrate-binding protein [Noviherbaspirillum humi]SNT38147.1 amino acid/amide ABC transporter substrate-binding protein, HAAT family [Noviherbaspirillum humi]